MDWYYLDALHEQHGPVNDNELLFIFRTSGDCLVWSQDQSGWIPASELLSGSTAVLSQVGLDSHGQPVNPRFNRMRRVDRSLAEMLGLVKGMIIDGVVSDAEAKGFNDWFQANREAVDAWPGSMIYARLSRILADGEIDPSERVELQAMFVKAVGDLPARPTENQATRLPLTDPVPTVIFTGKQFVFTGKFVSGTRNFCHELATVCGAQCWGKVVLETDYLVIGNLGSKDWIQTSHGRKIERALELSTKGAKISIISEQHWATSLPSQSRMLAKDRWE